MPETPTIVLREPNFVLATHGTIVIAAVDGVTTPDQVNAMVDHLRGLTQQHPGGTALLFIVRKDAALPPDETRQRFERGIRALQGKVKLLAGVIEGSGFAAATKRSVFTMIMSVFIGPVTVKVFPDALKGCAWLLAQGPGMGLALPAAAELTAFVTSLPATTAAKG